MKFLKAQKPTSQQATRQTKTFDASLYSKDELDHIRQASVLVANNAEVSSQDSWTSKFSIRQLPIRQEKIRLDDIYETNFASNSLNFNSGNKPKELLKRFNHIVKKWNLHKNARAKRFWTSKEAMQFLHSVRHNALTEKQRDAYELQLELANVCQFCGKCKKVESYKVQTLFSTKKIKNIPIYVWDDENKKYKVEVFALETNFIKFNGQVLESLKPNEIWLKIKTKECYYLQNNKIKHFQPLDLVIKKQSEEFSKFVCVCYDSKESKFSIWLENELRRFESFVNEKLSFEKLEYNEIIPSFLKFRNYYISSKKKVKCKELKVIFDKFYDDKGNFLKSIPRKHWTLEKTKITYKLSQTRLSALQSELKLRLDKMFNL